MLEPLTSSSTCTQERSDWGVCSSLMTDTVDRKGESLQRHTSTPHQPVHHGQSHNLDLGLTLAHSKQITCFSVVYEGCEKALQHSAHAPRSIPSKAAEQEAHLLVPSPETGGAEDTSSALSASEPVKILI